MYLQSQFKKALKSRKRRYLVGKNQVSPIFLVAPCTAATLCQYSLDTVLLEATRWFPLCFWPARQDSNLRPQESESCALSSCATGSYQLLKYTTFIGRLQVLSPIFNYFSLTCRLRGGRVCGKIYTYILFRRILGGEWLLCCGFGYYWRFWACLQ